MDVLRQSYYITKEAQEDYYSKNIWPDMLSEQPKNILLAFTKSEALIGYGGLVHIVWEHLRAELSFLLNPLYTRDNETYKELFLVFLKLIAVMAFDQLNLNRLFGETYAFRRFHISVMEEFGFCREGQLREHVIVNGNPTDAVMHGLLSKKGR